MGSFNLACKATNLPINCGDAVLAVPVSRVETRSGRGTLIT